MRTLWPPNTEEYVVNYLSLKSEQKTIFIATLCIIAISSSYPITKWSYNYSLQMYLPVPVNKYSKETMIIRPFLNYSSEYTVIIRIVVATNYFEGDMVKDVW